jgi:hypothetical protein
MEGSGRGGQAALPTVLLIGGVIIEIAIAGALVAYILSSSGWGERLSARALAAARAGIEDAFIKITINKNFNSPAGYDISIDNQTVTVTVIKDPGGYPTGTTKIISTGRALSRQRKLEGILVIQQETGKVDLKSLQETE